MNARIQRFVDNRWLEHAPATDENVVELWASAIESYDQARTFPPRYRFLAGYDAGRIAAQAIVHSRNLRVRAANHHEMTIQAAGHLSEPQLRSLLQRLDETRKERNALEYGGAMRTSSGRADSIIELVTRLLPLAAENLREERPSLAERIQFTG